jgi:hypothetical protein
MPQRLIVLSTFASGLWGGDGTLALPGSGTSAPGGLENVFEYNGLIFHDRTVVDKYRVTKITGLRDADVRDGTREVRTDDHGEDAGESKYGGRSLIFEGIIQAHNIGKLRDMEQGLRTAFAGLKEKPLIFRTGNIDLDVQIMVKKQNSIGGDEEQNNLRPERTFQIPLRASNPRWLSLKTERYSVPITGEFAGELARPINHGNFDAQPIIKIFNAPTRLTLRNETPLMDEDYAREMVIYGGPGTPSPLIIDTADREVTDEDGNPYYSLLSTSSDDIGIASGENVITCVAEGAQSDMRIEIEYSHSWI